MPPPPLLFPEVFAVAVLFWISELVTVTVPPLVNRPPPPTKAAPTGVATLLWSRVELVIDGVPTLLKMPPPPERASPEPGAAAEQFETIEFVTVTDPPLMYSPPPS